jgi:hypothetical protein
MLPPRALALLAALALGLGSWGCKPSSLTPLGIGEREPAPPGTDTNGLWSGGSPTGQGISFAVGDNTVVNLTLRHGEGSCGREFTAGEPIPIENDAFALETRDAKSLFVIEGRFTSPTDCSGTYRFEFFSTVGGCPAAGGGSFVATKAP